MVPPQAQAGAQTIDEAEEDLLEMQNKVNQLQAMLQMLGGDIDDMDDDDAPAAQPAPAAAPRSVPTMNGRPGPPMTAPMMRPPGGAPKPDDDPLAGLAGLSGLGDALSGLEEKKRKIEQLAAMLNINLDDQ